MGRSGPPATKWPILSRSMVNQRTILPGGGSEVCRLATLIGEHQQTARAEIVIVLVESREIRGREKIFYCR